MTLSDVSGCPEPCDVLCESASESSEKLTSLRPFLPKLFVSVLPLFTLFTLPLLTLLFELLLSFLSPALTELTFVKTLGL